MRQIIFIITTIFTFGISNAQIHEIGIFAGGSNYIGDVGPTNYIAPNKTAIGLLYKWNKSPRHAYRFSYTQSTLYSNDLNSDEISRVNRGFSFKNNIKEFSAGLEFNFFDFNLHEIKTKVTPYVYTGISYFFHDELYIDTNGITQKDGNNSAFAIPIIIGVKTNIARNFVLGVEVGARYTFTDNLDGSYPDKSSYGKFGNFNNTDWYVFSGITLTYTFGEKPCYCAY